MDQRIFNITRNGGVFSNYLYGFLNIALSMIFEIENRMGGCHECEIFPGAVNRLVRILRDSCVGIGKLTDDNKVIATSILNDLENYWLRQLSCLPVPHRLGAQVLEKALLQYLEGKDVIKRPAEDMASQEQEVPAGT